MSVPVTKSDPLAEIEILRRRVAQLEANEVTLRAAEHRWRTMVEFAPDFVLTVDRQGRIRYVNRVANGFRMEDVIGIDVYCFLYPDHVEVVREALRVAFETGVPTIYEGIWRQADGTDRWFESHVGPVRHGGVVVEAVIHASEITARKHDQEELRRTKVELENRVRERTADLETVNEALRQSLERFDLMVRGAQQGLWDACVNRDNVFDPKNPVYYSSYAKEMLGYRDDELPDVLDSWLTHLHPDDRERVFQSLADHLFRKVPYEVEYRLIDRAGQVRWFLAKGQAVWDEAGNPLRISGSYKDITERKLSELKTLDEQEFLRGLLRAHERDRQLLAYEIHDGLVQDITASVWRFEGLASVLTELSDEHRRSFATALDLLRRSIGDARRVLGGLRPPILDEQGVVAAIGYLVAECESAAATVVQFAGDPRIGRLEPLLECAMFRIVQEALNNIRKHSQARLAAVRLERRGDRLRLTIEDDGKGFGTASVPPDRFGLQGILKRTFLVGGEARIDSGPGRGTRIDIDLPYTPAEDVRENA